ncbi:MAG: hypothetical protein RLZZ237_329 [Pseudomonadota bacterium]|jgi:multidrug efflux system membrane fusion protein
MNHPIHTIKKRFAPLAAAIAAAGLFSTALSACDSHAGPAQGPSGAPVSAAVVSERAVTETQEFSGRMEAIERVEVRPRVSGFITSVKLTPGGIVKKGEVLFVIDPRPFQAETKRAEAAAVAARAKLDLAKIELVRAEKLVAEKAIAQRELDANASSFKELEANAQAAEAQADNARLNLSYTRVTSPIDGRVGKAEITVGNLVDTSAMLTTVVSDDKIYASFDGDEDTLLRVGAAAHQGRKIEVRVGLANETGYPHGGTLEFVDNQLDPRTGAVRMRAVFANTDKKLVPGLFARVQLQGGGGGVGSVAGERGNVLLINERAIGTDQSRKFVYVVSAGNKAEYRTVTLGPVVDGLRVVRDGLKAGEQIVVNGLQRVQQGASLAPHMVSMDFDPNAPAPEKTSAQSSGSKPVTPSKG